MVATKNRSLHLEQISWVADVAQQILTHRAQWLNRIWVDAHPRIQNWVVLVPLVKIDRAVIGINGGLHRVADVVHLRHIAVEGLACGVKDCEVERLEV